MENVGKGNGKPRATKSGRLRDVDVPLRKNRKLHSTPASAKAGSNPQVDERNEADKARHRPLLAAAAGNGWMGAKVRQMGGRFPQGLVEAAQRASGLLEPTELLTYALAKVAFEDDYGERLLALEGTVPRGTFVEG